MSYEGMNTPEKDPAEIEQERLWKCFYEGVCPNCGKVVPEEHAGENLGFCNEHHLHNYQVANSTDVRLTFEEAKNIRDHTNYCQEWADELNITPELFTILHDGQKMSPERIREYLERETGKEAA